VTLQTPEPLDDTHDLAEFDSGNTTLDDWLRRRARPNQLSGASRTFILRDDDRVVGYYALASSSITTNDATGKMRRNMPDPIPVVALARLAISRDYQGQGIGRALVRDAAKRVIAAGDAIGIRGMIVHAISEEAKAFYLRLGFQPSPTHDMMLMVPLGDLRASL